MRIYTGDCLSVDVHDYHAWCFRVHKFSCVREWYFVVKVYRFEFWFSPTGW